jgi:hypothetical protein
MFDANGKPFGQGDHVTIGRGINGVVVFSIDTDEFSTEFPKDDWGYLGSGIMVKTERTGLIHLAVSDEDLESITKFSN